MRKRYSFAEGRLVNLGCATGHPSFVMNLIYKPNFGSNRIVEKQHPTKMKYTCYQNTLTKKLLHLAKIGVELETLRDDQAAYIGVEADGPFKPEYYRY
jgi:adenosylhomocysteinase